MFQRKTRLDRPLPLPVRVTLPGSLTRSTLRLLNAHGGVFNIFSAPSVTRSLSAILLSPFEFPRSSQRTRGRTGNQEGEVSDPPFFVPRTSRRARPYNTPCNTPLPCGGVAHFSFIPAGRPGGRPASGASLSASNGKSGGRIWHAGGNGRLGFRGSGPGGSEPDTVPQRGRGSELSVATSRISDRSGSLAHRDACRALIEGRPSTRVPVRYPAPA